MVLSHPVRRLLVAIVFFAAPGAFGKSRPKVLVIPDWRGHWTAVEKEKIAAGIAAGLEAMGLDRADDQTGMGTDPFPVDQRFAPCLRREACRFEYARTANASYLFAALLVKQGKSARLGLTLYDVPLLAETGFQLRKARDVPHLAALAPRLVGKLVAADKHVKRGTIDIDSMPPGDAVFIDGHAAGVTNLEQIVFAGSHLIRIERKGAAPHIVKLSVPADKSIRYEARFEKTVVPPETK